MVALVAAVALVAVVAAVAVVALVAAVALLSMMEHKRALAPAAARGSAYATETCSSLLTLAELPLELAF